jgi:hypothetical protein
MTALAYLADYDLDATTCGTWFLKPAAAPARARPAIRLVSDHPEIPSPAANTDDRGQGMTSEPIASKLRGLNDNARVSETEIRDYVADALDALGEPVKEIARHADATPPTVENWRQRRNTMSLPNFVRLCRQHPRFKAWAKRLLEMESALDPEFAADLVRLQAALSKTLERR